MPIASVQEFQGDPDDRSTANYDAISKRLNAEADPPAGLLIHTAGYVEPGLFRVFDVWESEEHHRKFRDERLMPLVQQAMSEGRAGTSPPREYTYELHDTFPR